MDYIYLDNNATTKLHPDVLTAMEIDLKGPPFNPSSAHYLGKKAKTYLLEAKKTIASNLKVNPEEIIFTSGGSEALNFLIKGSLKEKNSHIITTDIEHPCVYNTVLDLQDNQGYEASFIKGYPTLENVQQEIKPNTKLIVLSAVNSETGFITDIEKIADLAYENNITFIVDGVAMLGKAYLPSLKKISAIAFSSHKIHGPKGIGVAYINKSCKISPLILGGSQENNLRAGTENLAGILGTAKAFDLAYQDLDKNIQHMQLLRSTLEDKLQKHLNIKINSPTSRICNISNISFLDVKAEDLLILLDLKKVFVSYGSACSSSSLKPSRVLINIGLDQQRINSALRISFSRLNAVDEIEKACEIIIKAVSDLKDRSASK